MFGQTFYYKVRWLLQIATVQPSFLSYFETLSIGSAPGIEPAASRSAVTRSTEWANTVAVKPITRLIANQRKIFNPAHTRTKNITNTTNITQVTNIID